MSVADQDEVLGFWLDEVGPEGWFASSEALDAAVCERFGATWEAARDGALGAWGGTARGALALAVLLDQFPRNMFRGDARAFATDAAARRLARRAVERGLDMRLPETERSFLYLPFEHSESLPDQERSVWLMSTRTGSDDLALHARAHRAVIRRFGRFPFRNEALGRRSTGAEAEWLVAGGYGAEVRRLQAA